MTFCHFSAQDIPTKLTISLKGTPKYYDNQKTFTIEGIYNLYQTSVNGYPAWIQGVSY